MAVLIVESIHPFGLQPKKSCSRCRSEYGPAKFTLQTHGAIGRPFNLNRLEVWIVRGMRNRNIDRLYCAWLVIGTPFLTRKEASTLIDVLPLLMPS